MDDKPKSILVVVGGSPSSAIHTLNEQKPKYICFFISGESKVLIKGNILPKLEYQPEHYDWIETSIPQDLLECYRVLHKKLPDILEKWGIDRHEIAVEYTGGTKPMSVAAVLATIEHSSKYFYVGSKDPEGRDKGGIGVVLDGKEFTWYQTNPWDELAISARKEIALLFNHGRFTDAQERIEKLLQVVNPTMRPVYIALSELIEGYSNWDRFEYHHAQQKIFKALKSLEMFVAGNDDPLGSALDTIKENADFLKKLNEKSEESLRLDLLDLLANAKRRGDLAQRFDDAVARLYSALEAIARNQLRVKYQINNNHVDLECIPEQLREEYQLRYSDRDGVIKLGLEASYNLLASLGDEIGEKYTQREKELKMILYARNQSRLAHGTQPIGKETYLKLTEIIYDFAGVNEEELPCFPVLTL